MVEATCCPKIAQPSLQYGVGSNAKTPRLLKWKCVNGECNECGIEKLLDMQSCPILMNTHDIMQCIQWQEAPRQGTDHNGKQNTQLEVTVCFLPVSDIVVLLEESLKDARKHIDTKNLESSKQSRGN